MLQRPALHVDKRPLACRVHHPQHETGRGSFIFCVRWVVVERCQVEIVVILARQRLGRDRKPIEFTRKLNRFRFGGRPRNALFQQHPEILSATRQPVHPWY